MTSLVEFVEDGNTLETHDDVPEDIREQLYAEDRQARESHQKTLKPSTGNLPTLPITLLCCQRQQLVSQLPKEFQFRDPSTI
jgi:hypothetical protein